MGKLLGLVCTVFRKKNVLNMNNTTATNNFITFLQNVNVANLLLVFIEAYH